jgi:hypothetical protein
MAVTTSSRCHSARWTQGCPVYKLTRNSRATACGDFWPRWTADGGNDGLTARGIAIGWFPTRFRRALLDVAGVFSHADCERMELAHG